MAQAPDEVSPLAFLGRVPHGEMFPERWHGEQFVAVLAVYAGEVDEGEEALGPLREFGEPIVDFSGPMPYVEAQKLLDEDYPNGKRYYWKSQNVDGSGRQGDRTPHGSRRGRPLRPLHDRRLVRGRGNGPHRGRGDRLR